MEYYDLNCPISGELCDTEVNECDSSPCLHGGRCHDDIAKYTCTCEAEYTGVNCENKICDVSIIPMSFLKKIICTCSLKNGILSYKLCVG